MENLSVALSAKFRLFSTYNANFIGKKDVLHRDIAQDRTNSLYRFKVLFPKVPFDLIHQYAEKMEKSPSLFKT